MDALAEYYFAVQTHADTWVVAGKGMETPFIKEGKEYLYVFNPATGKHGFLDIADDIVIDDREFYRVS